MEQDDEWLGGRRYISEDSMATLLRTKAKESPPTPITV
jgi:hypothetical protein